MLRHPFRPVHNYAFGLIGASVGRLGVWVELVSVDVKRVKKASG